MVRQKKAERLAAAKKQSPREATARQAKKTVNTREREPRG